MAVTEIFPPNPPLHEDTSAPVLYLEGLSSIKNNWSDQVPSLVRTTYRTDGVLYIANKFLAFNPGEVETEAWSETYRARAIKRGACITWIAGQKLGSVTPDKVMDLIEPILETDGKLVVGMPIKNKGVLRSKLEKRLAAYDVVVHTSLKAACIDATSSFRRSNVGAI